MLPLGEISRLSVAVNWDCARGVWSWRSELCFFRRLDGNPLLSVVSSYPQRVLVASCKVALTCMTVHYACACTTVPCSFRKAFVCLVRVAGILVTGFSEVSVYRPAVTGLHWTARTHCEFVPLHKCLYQQMLLMVFLFFPDHLKCSCVIKSPPRWLHVFPIRTLQMCQDAHVPKEAERKEAPPTFASQKAP